MSTFPVRHFKENQVIFAEGARGDVAYILKKGIVEISVKVGDKKIVLTKLNPPAVFDEMSLFLREHKRTATATTLEGSEVVEINRAAFDGYIDKSPPVIANILTALAGRLQETTARAAKVPDLFMGVCEILNLLAIHANSEFLYEQTVRALSNAFSVDIMHIQELLAIMADFRLIEIGSFETGEKIIYLPEKDDFLQRAKKISLAHTKMSYMADT